MVGVAAWLLRRGGYSEEGRVMLSMTFWLLTALDPVDADTAFGLIDLGIGMPELGTVKLSDLESIVGPRKQPVMRDRYFQAARPLSEYLRLAQENASVLD